MHNRDSHTQSSGRGTFRRFVVVVIAFGRRTKNTAPKPLPRVAQAPPRDLLTLSLRFVGPPTGRALRVACTSSRSPGNARSGVLSTRGMCVANCCAAPNNTNIHKLAAQHINRKHTMKEGTYTKNDMRSYERRRRRHDRQPISEHTTSSTASAIHAERNSSAKRKHNKISSSRNESQM